MYTYGDLVLDAGDVEQRLDLLPQLVPRPGTQLQVLAQIALHHLQSDTLLLDLLVVLTGQVTSDPGLQPRHDLAQTVVTELLHLTQHSGAEEHLWLLQWPMLEGRCHNSYVNLSMHAFGTHLQVIQGLFHKLNHNTHIKTFYGNSNWI